MKLFMVHIFRESSKSENICLYILHRENIDSTKTPIYRPIN